MYTLYFPNVPLIPYAWSVKPGLFKNEKEDTSCLEPKSISKEIGKPAFWYSSTYVFLSPSNKYSGWLKATPSLFFKVAFHATRSKAWVGGVTTGFCSSVFWLFTKLMTKSSEPSAGLNCSSILLLSIETVFHFPLLFSKTRLIYPFPIVILLPFSETETSPPDSFALIWSGAMFATNAVQTAKLNIFFILYFSPL